MEDDRIEYVRADLFAAMRAERDTLRAGNERLREREVAEIRSSAIGEFAEEAGMKASEAVKALPEDVRRFRRESAFAALIAQEGET